MSRSRSSSTNPQSEKSRGSGSGVGQPGPTGTHTPVQRNQDLLMCLEEFANMVSAADDGTTVGYKIRPIWASHPVQRLVDVPLRLLEKIPASRGAVLQYIGLLTHEATHLFFTNRENVHFSADFENVERAVQMLTSEVNRLLMVTRLKCVAVDVLKWGCGFCVELCRLNFERPAAQKAGRSAPALLSFFESCPATNCVIKLTDKAVACLLEVAREECLNIIVDWSRHGFYFSWMFLHIASSFPSSMIPHLMQAGAEEFKQYALSANELRNPNPMEIHETYYAKFAPLCEVLASLALKRDADLRAVIRQMLMTGVERAEDSADEGLNPNSDLSLAFVFKMVCSSPEMLRFISWQTYDAVTRSVVLLTAKQLWKVGARCVLPKNNDSFLHFLHSSLFCVHTESSTHFFDLALSFAFDERVFEQLSRTNKALCNAMKAGAIEIVEEMMEMVLTNVHSQSGFSVSESGIMMRISCDSEKLHECVLGAMCGGARSQFFIRYLHGFCVATTALRTAELIARFIVDAEDEHQLSCLCALLVSVAPFCPNAAHDAIVHFSASRRSIEHEKRQRRLAESRSQLGVDGSTTSVIESADLKWMDNLRTLSEWEKSADENHPLRFVRFDMGRCYGPLMCDVLRVALDELSRIDDAKDKMRAEEVESLRASVVHSVCGLHGSLAPYSIVTPRYSYKICAQFASFLIMQLAYIGEEGQQTAFSLYMAACEAATSFMDSQVEFVRQQLITHLVDESLANAKELFGCSSLNVWEMEMEYAGGCSKSGFVDGKPFGVDTEAETSLIEEARKLSVKGQKPVQMAHSGLIGRGPWRSPKKEIKESEGLRRLVFIESLQRLCKTAAPNGSAQPIRSIYKHLAIVVTERLCKDGLTSVFAYDDWEMEKEFAHRYVSVAKRLRETPFIWDIMFAIADVHPVLWYCSPLVKAVLASLLMQFENTAEQESLPSKAHIELLDKCFFLMRKGRMLPPSMVCFLDVIAEVGYHEGFLILLDVWKYFRSILDAEVRPVEMVHQVFENSLHGPVPPIEGDVKRFREACRLVIQRHIDRLGFLFPVIFSDELSSSEGASS